MRLLLIEPDRATAQTVELMLRSEGFNVYTTDMAEEGLDLAKIYDYDIVLTETALPDFNGVDLIRRLRAAGVETPVMVSSGDHTIETKTSAFRVGADDYLTKPFHKDELVARVHALVRRSKGHAQAIVRAGKIAVNLDTKTVEVEGRRVPLTGKEYQMLELLALRKGSTLSKDAFLNHLYGGMDEPEVKIIDVFICKLRKKLAAAAGGDDFIHTTWGRGYSLRDEARPVAAPHSGKRLWRTQADQVLHIMRSTKAPMTVADIRARLVEPITSVNTALQTLKKRRMVRASRSAVGCAAVWSLTASASIQHNKEPAHEAA